LGRAGAQEQRCSCETNLKIKALLSSTFNLSRQRAELSLFQWRRVVQARKPVPREHENTNLRIGTSQYSSIIM
jgi:hypothetical protein